MQLGVLSSAWPGCSRRAQALAALCEQLSTVPARYPGTHLTVHYKITPHPGTA